LKQTITIFNISPELSTYIQPNQTPSFATGYRQVKEAGNLVYPQQELDAQQGQSCLLMDAPTLAV
jgi:hypothetical protein